MNEKFKVTKIKNADGEFVLEIHDLSTSSTLTLGKWDIWHLWCEIAR